MGPPGSTVEIGFRPHSSRQVHHIILHRTVQNDHPPPPQMILPPSNHHPHHQQQHHHHQVQQYPAPSAHTRKPDPSRFRSEWPVTPRDERGFPAPRDDRLPASQQLSQVHAIDPLHRPQTRLVLVAEAVTLPRSRDRRLSSSHSTISTTIRWQWEACERPCHLWQGKIANRLRISLLLDNVISWH
jgi:hypothetical protein